MAMTDGISGAGLDLTPGRVPPAIDSHEAWTRFHQLHALLSRSLQYAEQGDYQGEFDQNELVSLLEVAKELSGKLLPWVDQISVRE